MREERMVFTIPSHLLITTHRHPLFHPPIMD
nr:MAG TPA: hypothetical protein [Caudoviricetes sp.]